MLCNPTAQTRLYKRNTTVIAAGSSKVRSSKHGLIVANPLGNIPSLVTLIVVATTLVSQTQNEIQFDPRINTS